MKQSYMKPAVIYIDFSLNDKIMGLGDYEDGVGSFEDEYGDEE